MKSAGEAISYGESKNLRKKDAFGDMHRTDVMEDACVVRTHEGREEHERYRRNKSPNKPKAAFAKAEAASIEIYKENYLC